MESDTIFELEALGRVAQLGGLYDARSFEFLDEGISLFNSGVEITFDPDNSESETPLKPTIEDTYYEKFELLQASGESKLSVLAGSFELKGSGKYFNCKTSAKSVMASLIKSILTKYERINLADTSLAELVNKELLAQVEATHVVIGIQWGGRVFISVEDMNTQNKDKEILRKKMSPLIEKLAGCVDVRAGTPIKMTKKQKKALNKFKIQRYGDMFESTQELSYIDIEATLKSAPGSLKEITNGKGKAIKYILLPVNILRKTLGVSAPVRALSISIDEKIIEYFVFVFNEMNKAAQRINDVVNDAKEKEKFLSTESMNELITLQNGYNTYQAEFKQIFSDNLILVRSGEKTAEELQDKMYKIKEESGYNSYNIDEKLKKFDYLKKDWFLFWGLRFTPLSLEQVIEPFAEPIGESIAEAILEPCLDACFL